MNYSSQPKKTRNFCSKKTILLFLESPFLWADQGCEYQIHNYFWRHNIALDRLIGLGYTWPWLHHDEMITNNITQSVATVGNEHLILGLTFRSTDKFKADPYKSQLVVSDWLIITIEPRNWENDPEFSAVCRGKTTWRYYLYHSLVSLSSGLSVKRKTVQVRSVHIGRPAK